MKYRFALPASLFPLLASLAAAQSAAPTRIEQGNLIFDGIPTATSGDAAALGHWLESRGSSFVDWLADGSLLISTRFANVAQLHRVRTPLGMREQLSWSEEPLTRAVTHPYDARVLLYMKDRGGDENMQIWKRDLATGEEKLLTDGKSLYGTPVFAQDGKRIAYYSNARDGGSYDIYISDITTDAAPRLVISGDSAELDVEDWSMDDARLAVIRYRSITDSELLIGDVATGTLKRFEPAADFKGGTASVRQARFSRDGRGIYFISDRGGEFTELRYADLYTGEQQSLTPGTQWDIDSFRLSADNRFIAYVRNEAGIDRLVLHDIAAKADVLLPPLPANSVISSFGFDRGSRQLAVALETAQSPRDVYVYSLKLAADAAPAALPEVGLARWTQGELGPLNAARLVPAQPIAFPTWDNTAHGQRVLSGFIYRPATPGPHPVLIDIHGGPEDQYQPGWNPFTQYLVNELGYAVVEPNVRGSAGYGRSFLQLDNGVLREDAVRDIGSLLVWIGLQPDLDRNRIVVMGGSYGGYMALASLVNYSDRLAGGIDVVGISNFVTFLTNTSAYRRDLRRAEYGDERDPKMRDFLQGISPLSNAKAIRKPLLIVQGLNDPRVPPTESAQMMSVLRAGGGEVWYLAAKDEGHGFRKKGNVDVYRATVAQFLRRLNP